jgi:glutamate formiminotransferase/formiminotetrahydrofolate cyclodeaminase
MNLTDYRRTPVHRAVELIRREARRHGVNVVSSELVGLIPRQALMDAAEHYLQIEDFNPEMVLESHLEEPEDTPAAFLDAVAVGTPIPGGGSVSALAGALAASLASMGYSLTLAKKPDEPVAQIIEKALGDAERLRGKLGALVEEDASVYQGVLEAYRLPKATPEEKPARSAAIQQTLEQAARVPLKAAQGAVEVLELLPMILESGLSSAASDVGVAAYMAEAAVKGAALNVRTNLGSLRDETLAASLEAKLHSLEDRSAELMVELERELAARI